MGVIAGMCGHVSDMLGCVADVLWPPQCHMCGSRTGRDDRWLCMGCRVSLPKTYLATDDMNMMKIRLAKGLGNNIGRAAAWLRYRPGGRIAPLFHDFKYNGFRHLARHLGAMAGHDFGMMPFFNDMDALLPVPVHMFKKLRRGYNQSEEIAAGLSGQLHIPVAGGLRAVRPHRTQTGMTYSERLVNTDGVFRYTPQPEFRGKHVVIVDDVFTTGSTMISAGRAVLEGDPEATVSFFALGMASVV